MRRMLIVAIFLSLVAVSAAWAQQQYWIHGTVYYQGSGQPVGKGFTVKAQPSGDYTTTQSGGGYSLLMYEGTWIGYLEAYKGTYYGRRNMGIYVSGNMWGQDIYVSNTQHDTL